jgi:hypothetical protein
VTREKTAGAVSADGEVRVPEWEELGSTRLFSERVRKEQEAKELREIEEVQEAAWAAFRRG